jgi:hypothetical protein
MNELPPDIARWQWRLANLTIGSPSSATFERPRGVAIGDAARDDAAFRVTSRGQTVEAAIEAGFAAMRARSADLEQ